jgi:hypothetical protein
VVDINQVITQGIGTPSGIPFYILGGVGPNPVETGDAVSARYAQHVYGDPLVYGVGEPSGLLAWGIMVDWNNDGVFAGENEALRMIDFESFRGRKKQMKKAGAGYELIPPAKFNFTLLNGDGRYDEFNTSSPLYPYVQAGVDVMIIVQDQQNNENYHVVYGIVDDIVPSYSGNKRTVKIYCTDVTASLTKNTARVAVSSNISPEAAIGYVLDYMNWPERWGRLLNTSTDVIPHYWASGSKQALTEIQDIAQSYFGYFFADNQGRARFIKRTATSLSAADFTQEQLLKDMGNAALYDNYRNVTRIKLHPRQLSSLTTLYQLVVGVTPPLIGQGISNKQDFWGNYTYNNALCPASNVIPPEETTDYTFNSAANGSGIDYTSSVTATFVDFGDNFKISIVNNAPVDVYCTKLQVRGYALYEPNVSDVTYPNDVSTVENQRELNVDLAWLQDMNVARDLANVIGAFVGTRNPTPTIVIEGRPDLQFVVDLFDIVTLTAPAIGVNGPSFRVGGIGHKTIVDTCQAVRTTIYLEPYIAGGQFWTWPITDFGVDTVFGW